MRYVDCLQKILFPRRERERRLTSLSALDGFVQNICWGEDVSVAVAHRRAEEGVVTLRTWHSRANAVLITSDGYFLTADHCVKRYVPPRKHGMRIITHNGEEFPVTNVCACNRRKDLALCKADLPAAPAPLRYRFFDWGRYERRLAVRVVTRNDGLHSVYGFLEGITPAVFGLGHTYEETSFLHDQWTVSVNLRPGDSGGLLLDAEARVLGFVTTGPADENHDYRGTCARLPDALALIATYVTRRRTLYGPRHT